MNIELTEEYKKQHNKELQDEKYKNIGEIAKKVIYDDLSDDYERITRSKIKVTNVEEHKGSIILLVSAVILPILTGAAATVELVNFFRSLMSTRLNNSINTYNQNCNITVINISPGNTGLIEQNNMSVTGTNKSELRTFLNYIVFLVVFMIISLIAIVLILK